MNRKHKSDLVILFTTLGLMALGLIVIYAIGPMRANVLNTTYGTNYGPNDFFIGQLRSVGLSLIAFFLAFKVIPYQYVRKFAKPLLIFALLLSALLWFLSLSHASIVKCELGECRWFQFGSLSFQPAEILKLALVIYLADFLARKREENKIGDFKEFWLPLIIVCGMSLGLVVVAQGDLGTGVALIAIIFGMLLVAGVPKWQYLLMLVVVIGVAVGSVVISSHRMERVNAWITTLTGGESTDSTYHIDNAMLAIGTGGFTGVGIGNSVQATGYLPESIIIGVFSWTLAQVTVNIMAMTSLVPVTGITLPLLSYGGTSMLFIAFAIGEVCQLSCYTSREGIKHEDISSRGRQRGTHHAGSRRHS